ncbi:MAG: gamma-glutamyl-gamma-aminobutyrate hydrolase family protein [Solirubrobacterales bacterium]
MASLEHRPLIGVTTSEVRPKDRVSPVPESEPVGVEMALGITYLKAIEAAGGLPLVMPPLADDAIEPLLDRLDGICLSGGPDLDPSLYEAKPHPELGPIEPELDRFELAVAARADAREMPILAICRGTQALNIVRGGALHQHLPDLSTEVSHRQSNPGTEPSHAVEVDPDSQLAEVLGGDEVEVSDVNSFHHQAIDRLGEGLRVSARAPDGTVEAIEDPDRRFLIGVQWHAETLVHRRPEAELFRRFVEACRDDGVEYERVAGREVA